MSGDPFSIPVMTLFINVTILDKYDAPLNVRVYFLPKNSISITPISLRAWARMPLVNRASPSVRISKIVTFINMDITGVKNGFPDMILTPFDGKFNKKKDEIPPGICRPHILQIIQYWEFECWHKTQKWS